MPEPTTSKSVLAKDTPVETKTADTVLKTQVSTTDKPAAKAPQETVDPKTIKYAKTERVGEPKPLDNGSVETTYKLSEPKDDVEDKYKTQTHVITTVGKKRTSYLMYSGDKADPGALIGELDVSVTG